MLFRKREEPRRVFERGGQEGRCVLTELAGERRVVGVKQTRRAVREGRARRVYLARDADPAVTGPIEKECAAAGIPVERDRTMAQLGRACGISVGAAAAAVT